MAYLLGPPLAEMINRPSPRGIALLLRPATTTAADVHSPLGGRGDETVGPVLAPSPLGDSVSPPLPPMTGGPRVSSRLSDGAGGPAAGTCSVSLTWWALDSVIIVFVAGGEGEGDAVSRVGAGGGQAR